ncbi:uncharacterized protein BKA55DRAFT_692885 [Fusarium redolens]|uniref:Filamentous hemagglutinin n=1 Tax=Fusarium redolens TaxID=48865 RepID=A0A9P9GS06_FUSRE|nr:uncharacterized protein BKA55DRAFT_692885 [Fusarium redolens]KAH7243722.1 hypothetical protein BKA55DRAFT_692885 [Fusarium redolens]
MKFQLTILTLAVLALAKPQAPPDPTPAPPDPDPTPPSTSEQPAPPPVPPPADPPADPPAEPSQPPPPPPPPPSQPDPSPPPSGPAPVPPPATPAPAPPPDPSPPPPPPPSSTASPPPEGPICECGYTYCSSVLKDMDKPWNDAQLSEAYCTTPNANCDGETPASSIDSALFICLCDQPSQKIGNHVELLCGCDTCLVVKPDFRGRCKSPCRAGGSKDDGKGDGKGNKVRGTNRLGFWM